VIIKQLKTITMKRNEKKAPEFDEIIFENRNKEYGAYNLRKNYKSATSLSILGATAICALSLILISAFTPKEVSAEPDKGIIIVITPVNKIDPDKIVPPEIKKPVAVPVQNKYVAPDIVEDSVDVGNMMMINDIAADSVQNGTVTEKIDSVVYKIVAPEPEKEPFFAVEEPPMFPGGESALLEYIAENTKYPAEALENNIQGKVIVRFAVSADGSVKRIEVLRGVHPLLDEEAVRVISTLPLWKPGKQNGKPVPVWFFVPVRFQVINK
jgi:protein TonB